MSRRIDIQVRDPRMELPPPDYGREVTELFVRAQRDFERGMAIMEIRDQHERLLDLAGRLGKVAKKIGEIARASNQPLTR